MLVQKNLRGPNGGHFCCLRQNDELSLVLVEKQPGRFYAMEAYTSCEVSFTEFEISRVAFIDPAKDWRFFAQRVVPPCGCGILLWIQRDSPQHLRVGDFVKHRTVEGDDGSQRFHGEDISLLSEEQVKDLNLETGQGAANGQV
jgi:hypothetical protein